MEKGQKSARASLFVLVVNALGLVLLSLRHHPELLTRTHQSKHPNTPIFYQPHTKTPNISVRPSSSSSRRRKEKKTTHLQRRQPNRRSDLEQDDLRRDQEQSVSYPVEGIEVVELVPVKAELRSEREKGKGGGWWVRTRKVELMSSTHPLRSLVGERRRREEMAEKDYLQLPSSLKRKQSCSCLRRVATANRKRKEKPKKW